MPTPDGRSEGGQTPVTGNTLREKGLGDSGRRGCRRGHDRCPFHRPGQPLSGRGRPQGSSRTLWPSGPWREIWAFATMPIDSVSPGTRSGSGAMPASHRPDWRPRWNASAECGICSRRRRRTCISTSPWQPVPPRRPWKGMRDHRDRLGTPGTVLTFSTARTLTAVDQLIGTGGIFIHHPRADLILRKTLFSRQNPFPCGPKQPNLYTDAQYCLYAIGLLADRYPDQALRIARKYLKKWESPP